MTGRLERLVVRWLRTVAPRGWSETVIGDLREDLDARGRGSRARTLALTAAVAARFTVEATAARLRRPRTHRTGRRNMDILTDLRQAARALWRTPGFSLVAILTLALAIGANTAIYSALSSIVLNPLPFKDGNRFVYLYQKNPGEEGLLLSPRRKVADQWRDARHVFEVLEYYTGRPMTLTGSGEPEQVEVTFVRPSALAMFGVQPVIGRTFVEGDTHPSSPPVAIVSQGVWQSRFGGQREIGKQSVTLNGVAHTVVGVMPSRFVLPLGSDTLWVAERRGVDDREGFGVSTIAKLARGITPEQAQAAIDALPRASAEAGEDAWPGRVMTPADYHGSGLKTALYVLSGAVGLLLLIACVNVANLTLSRYGGRRREIVVRHALGASRGRITRYLLAESAILAATGGLAGLAVAVAGLSVMSDLRPENLPVLDRLALDQSAMVFAAVVTAVTGLLFGLGPALAASRANLSDAIKVGGRSATASGQAVRGLLTVAQVALALILLVGAGLLIRSYAKLMAVDPGYNADGVLAVDVFLPADRYPDANPGSQRRFFDETLSTLESLPGVATAAVGSMPARPMMMFATLSIEGRPDMQARPLLLAGGYVTESYFRALGVPIQDGRGFTADDTDARDRVAIVNETFAKRFWPGESAVGKRLRASRDDGPWLTVVGVAADVRFGGLSGMSSGRLQLYFPRSQTTTSFGTFILRASGDPLALIPAVKASIWNHDAQIPLTRIATARELLARSASERRFNLTLLALFAACGLLLAVVGVYGVTALLVGQRQREVGIRMALGATRGAVARLILRQTAILLIAAVVAGGLGAWWLSRYLESLVFETATTDALTFATAIAAVVIASIAATLVPMRRATSVDPAIVLRTE